MPYALGRGEVDLDLDLRDLDLQLAVEVDDAGDLLTWPPRPRSALVPKDLRGPGRRSG